MRLTQPLIFAASALLMLPTALATAPAAAQQADPDNPPIETIKNAKGESIRIQRFQRSAFDIDPARLRIGQRKMLRAAFGDLVGQDRTVRVECPAMAAGRLDPDLNCRAASGADEEIMPARLATRLMRLSGSAFPATIPEVPLARLRTLRRVIQFDVRIKAFPTTEPDPPSGPLLDSKDVAGLNRVSTQLDFPAAARRTGAQGRMVALCQVQMDLSIACTQESFDPPANAPIFAPAAASLFQAGRVDPVLANGAKAEGARFRYAVNFALGK